MIVDEEDRTWILKALYCIDDVHGSKLSIEDKEKLHNLIMRFEGWTKD
jgi:hypothetical protein